MNNDIQTREVSEDNIETYLQQIIELYRKVFSESSWEEGLKCINSECSFNCSYSKAPKNKSCPNCTDKLTDYYSESEVEGFVRGLFENEYYQALLGLDDTGKVVAFTWGWVNSLISLNNEKLGLGGEEFAQLQENMRVIGIEVQQDFYYLSEMGITPKLQGQGIGKKLATTTEGKIKGFVENVLLRTSEDSGMYNIAVQGGYDLVYEYKDAANRVIFAKRNNIGN